MGPPLSHVPFSRKEWAYLLSALFLILVVHVGSFLFFRNLSAQNPTPPHYPIVAGDSLYYSRVAGNLLTYHVFTDSVPELTPTNANLPGYPFMLAATKYVTGSFLPLIPVQVALTLLSVLLIFAIGRRVVPWQMALIAGVVYGLEPMVVYTTTALLTDSLFTTFLLLLVYVGFIQHKVRDLRRAIAVGLLLGVCAMVRPTGMLLVPIVIFFLSLQEYLRLDAARLRTAVVTGVVALVGAMIFMGPWMFRNHTQLGTFQLFHSGPHAFLDYNVRYFLSWREMGKTGPVSVYYPARHLGDPAVAVVDQKIRESLATLTPPGEDPEQYVGKLAFTYIASDPIRYIYFHAAHVPVFFLSSSIGAYKQAIAQISVGQSGGRSTMYETLSALRDLSHPDRFLAALVSIAPVILEVGWWTGIVFLALLGLYIERRRIEVWLYAALIGYFALIVGAFTVARYRIPTEPFLLLLASYSLYTLGSGVLAAYRAGKSAGERVPGWSRFTAFVRYVVSGVSALLTSVIIYSVLTYGFGVWYITASMLGFVASFFVSFVLQKFFAFRDQTPPGRGQQVAGYLALLVFNIGINTLMLTFFVDYIGTGTFLGLLFANSIVVVWNYFVYDKILFTDRELEKVSLNHPPRGSLGDLSIVIPCLNEEGSIGAVLDSIPAGVHEVIVVDNNCTDGTARIAQQRGARIVKEAVPGTGAAMRTGFRAATGSIIAVIDGDNQHPAGELPRILDMLEGERMDFISAARFPLSDSWFRGFGNWSLTLMVNVLFGLTLTDSQSGMVMFRRSLLSRIEPKSDDVVFVQELKIRAAREEGVRFAECRIPCVPRMAGTSKLLPLRHGFKLLIAMFSLRSNL